MPNSLVTHPVARMISNPTAGGTGRRQALREAIGVLADYGWHVSWCETNGPGDALHLAAEAAALGMDVVVAAGGDGTINEIANGLAASPVAPESRPALGILPGGTGNVIAAQLGLLGIPTPIHRADMPAAAERLATGTIRNVDLGFALPRGRTGRYFLMGLGVGLDAEVTLAVEGPARELKRAIGPAAFGAMGVKTVLETVGTPGVVRANGRRIKDRLLLGIVSNIRLYAGAVVLSPGARIDDGLLDVELFCGEGPLDVMGHLGAVIAGRRDGPERVSLQAKRVRIVTARPMPVQLDGDPFATTPVTISTCPGRLRLLVPYGAPSVLFSTDGVGKLLRTVDGPLE
jgi:diacylglycerol kinase (ATP)